MGKIEIKPKTVLTNNINNFEFKQSAWDEDGVSKNLPNNEFIWSIQDSNIATIDENGILSGNNDGTTEVYLIYENLIDTAIVNIVNISGKALLHSFNSTDNLSLNGENLILDYSYMEIIEEPISEGNASMKVVYEYIGNPSKIYNLLIEMNNDIDGVPDSIKVDLMTNGDRNQLIYFLEDDNDEEFQINEKKWADNSAILDFQPGAFSNITSTSPGDIFSFPVTLTGMLIKLNGPKENGIVYKDSLVIDNLRISYPDISSSMNDIIVIPSYIRLNQNYPNPFNPTTTIKYSIPLLPRKGEGGSEGLFITLKI